MLRSVLREFADTPMLSAFAAILVAILDLPIIVWIKALRAKRRAADRLRREALYRAALRRAGEEAPIE